MKKPVEIINVLDMKLIKPEQLEWVAINKNDIEASCVTSGEQVNVKVILWESYRIDTGQCGEDNGIEYIIGEEQVEYNIIYNDIGLKPTGIKVDDIRWRYEIDENTREVTVTANMNLDFIYE